jgi:hypothetical protein
LQCSSSHQQRSHEKHRRDERVVTEDRTSSDTDNRHTDEDSPCQIDRTSACQNDYYRLDDETDSDRYQNLCRQTSGKASIDRQQERHDVQPGCHENDIDASSLYIFISVADTYQPRHLMHGATSSSFS